MKLATILFLALTLLATRPGEALECLHRYAATVHDAWIALAKSPAEAAGTLEALTPLAEDGYAPAMHALAIALRRADPQGQHDAAQRWMRLAAARGYPPAYAQLGDASLAEARTAALSRQAARARFLELEALFWYRLGEVHGEPDALWGVAQIYRRGAVVQAAPTIAFNASLSAIEQGVTSAPATAEAAQLTQDRLTQLTTDYLDGHGTAPDVTQAYRWTLLRVAKLGAAATPQDLAAVEDMASRVKPQEADRAQKLAESWQPQEPPYSVRAPYAFEPVPVTESIIRRVEGALVGAGLQPGPVDGIFGTATARAIVEMEALVGAPATAAVTHRLLSALQIQELPSGEQTCADAWLDEQPAFSSFVTEPIPLDGTGDAFAMESMEEFGEMEAMDGVDAPDPAADSIDDSASGVDEMLDQVISNNEEMLRHLSINEMVEELREMPAALSRVGPSGPAVCIALGDLLDNPAAVATSAGTRAATGCDTPPDGAVARVLWCIDQAAQICEVEIEDREGGAPLLGWTNIGALE